MLVDNSAPTSLFSLFENPTPYTHPYSPTHTPTYTHTHSNLLTPHTLQPTHPHTNMQVLTQELDVEREQRWKAEQAAGRLVEHVRTLQSQLTEAQRRHELAVVRAAQLEREVGEERGGVQGLQGQVQELQVCVCMHMCACVWDGGEIDI